MNPVSMIPTTGQDVTSAGAAYNTAQSAANTSGEQDLTLPQMLTNSLTATTYNSNNPNITNQATDTANYQQALNNAGMDPAFRSAPSSITTGPGGQSGNVPLGPNAQATMMDNSVKNAAIPLNADNLILAMQNNGLLNVIKNIASTHAADTQKLVDSANLAYNNWQTQVQQLDQKAQLAETAAQLAEQTREFNQNPAQIGIKLFPQVQAAAKSYSSFQDLVKAFGSNPALTAINVTPQILYSLWHSAHPNSAVDSQYLQSIGVNSGNILQGASAALNMNTENLTAKINPTTQGVGIGGLLGLLAGIPGGVPGMMLGGGIGASIGGGIGWNATNNNGGPKIHAKPQASWY